MRSFLCLCFFSSLLISFLQAQIPQQPIRPPTNPNAIPPAGAPRPFSRPNAQQPALPTGGPANGSEAKPTKKPEEAITPEGMVQLQYPNTQLSEILLLYEELTGKKIIRDANAETATVSIETTGELPKEQAIMYIEKSLLLNGYAFTPAGEGMVKLLAFDAKKPSMEGAPLIEAAAELPQTDQVVSFVTLLRYLGTEDAIKAIDQVIPRHSYGTITPVPNARALIITENSNTIRSILSLLERLDNKPADTIQKTIQLTRSSAEDVKKALDEILGTDEKNDGSGKTPAIPQNTPGSMPGQTPATPAVSANYDGAGGATEAEPPKIISIPRRNCLMLIGAQEQIDYISRLVEELDAASELRTFASRPLKYLAVDAAMQIISDAILRTEGDDSGSGGANNTGTGTGTTGQNNNNSQNRNNSGSLFGNNNSLNNNGFNNGMNGGLNGGLGGSSGIGGGGASLSPLRENRGPASMLVGKTLLISDPVSNSIFASGPPEHLRVLNEIMDELDHRPQQVRIAAVIGEHSLSDSRRTGIRTFLRNRGNNAGQFGSGGPAGKSLIDPTSGTAIALADLASSNGLTFFGNLSQNLDVSLQLVAGDSDFHVLSRPVLFTTNNTPVRITSGTSIPIQQSSQNLGTAGGLIANVQYQDVLLSLSVVPLINTSDELTLQIVQENSELGSERLIGEVSYPELSKQQFDTTVVCKNKSTVLLGGLMREDDRRLNTSVPVLNRIPILRLLTGDRQKSIARRELLIFIEPRIIEGLDDLPPTVDDPAGNSLHAADMKAALADDSYTRRNLPQTASTAKPNFSERMKGMFKKLLQ